MKPYYEHGDITIYHGDYREAIEMFITGDCIIADPPYAQTSLDGTCGKRAGRR